MINRIGVNHNFVMTARYIAHYFLYLGELLRRGCAVSQ